MKKLAIFLICFFPIILLLSVFTVRFKPDGSFYLTFLTQSPVVIAGDGSSYQDAYQLRHGHASDLTTAESQTIRDRYGTAPGRADLSNNLAFANTNLNGRAYDVVTFTLSNQTRTVYFDVTSYKSRTQP